MRRLLRPATRPRARAPALALLLGATGAWLQLATQPLGSVDASAQDAVLAHRTPESYLGDNVNTPRDPRSFITIVAIDERTLAELGAYNGGYPRAYHAQVIENLLAAPPRVIALDLGFFESTPDDAQLASALTHAQSLPVPTTVILSGAGLPGPNQSGTGELTFDRGLEPVPALAQHAQTALANVVPDEHGTIRGMPLVAFSNGVERPSLGLAAVAAYLRRQTFLDGRTDGSLQLAGRSIPVDASQFMRINFFGPPSSAYTADSTFRVVSFVDVLRGRVDPRAWRGGLVFVGALGATGLADDYWTPTSDQGRKMAGVEIHANAAATLFSMNFLRPAPDVSQVALILVVALLMALLATSLNVMAAFALAGLGLTIFVAANLLALYAWGWLTPLGAPLAVGAIAFVGALVPRLSFEQREARAARQELVAEQQHDRLTGLANRAQLLAALRHGIEAKDSRYALLLLDIDRFKDVNDTLGHEAGDRLLRDLSGRLNGQLTDEAVCVARLGGDEFGVVVRGAGSARAMAICTSLLESLEVPVLVDERPLSIAASIGIALYPDHGADPETLLRHADTAMYAAKQARSGFAAYSADQEKRAAERLDMVNGLRSAIADGDLRLQYQPKVDCRTGRITGVEALVRWLHPEYGMIPPSRFVPLAEETGLVGALTRWVLEAAVRQAAAWLNAGRAQRVAVNLSAHDLRDEALPTRVRQLLETYAVPPELLSLEITETALLIDPAGALEVLNVLNALGVGASLDDFGTGYSSLTYLRQLPLRELKIDASFVQGLLNSDRDEVIVRSTIELGHRLGLTVVAEGVEDARTLEVLTELGCDQVQGYLLARPQPADDLDERLRGGEELESRRAEPAA